MELEDKTYESWKAWATKEVQAIEMQRSSAYTGVGAGGEEDAEDAETETEISVIS
jgi:small subunit ribosomal protein S23